MLKVPIYCPICRNPFPAIRFVEESERFIHCDKCNSAFNVTLQEGRGKRVKIHDDLSFEIQIHPDKTLALSAIDQADPTAHCILCKSILPVNLEDGEVECKNCGAIYLINFTE